MPKLNPPLTSAKCIRRYENNPILTPEDIPYISEAVYNAAVIKRNGKYIMLFRNDYNWDWELHTYKPGDSSVLGIADSDDGIHWNVRPKPFEAAIKLKSDEVTRIYDPRITEIEGELYICFAMDTNHGLRGGIGRIIGDFEDLEVLSLSVPDNRNMVLFPEKINGMYVRLERPFPVYGRAEVAKRMGWGHDRFDIWISYSPDLKFWGESKLLAAVEDFPYTNDKIGPAAPPIKTDKGWLLITHGVDLDTTRGKNGWEPKWQKRYCAGVMLVDLEDPSKVLGIYKKPLIAPEVGREIENGMRENVIFPCACIKEDNDVLKIYYGASDTVTCLAETTVSELVDLCLNGDDE
ncbi:MAG: glycosidase [Ruminococcaceae bacterium]|nr:glycosidase [Oscillospiraceae bacterium]